MATELQPNLQSVPARPASNDVLGPYADLFDAIKQEWNKAEQAIKRSEQIALDVSIPAISELRYAGRRLVDALHCASSSGDDAQVRAFLEDARFCCHRAQHDAIDAAFSKIAIDLDDLTSKLGFEAVLQAYPDFREFYAEFRVARAKIALSRGNRDDRNGIYEAITAVDLPGLADRHERLMANRPIAKNAALRMKVGGLVGAAGLIATILAAVFAGLAVDWSKYLPSDRPAQHAR